MKLTDPKIAQNRRLSSLLRVALIALVSLAGAPHSADAQRTANIAHFNGSAVTGNRVIAALRRGRANRFLFAHATVQTNELIPAGDHCDITLKLDANGVPLDNFDRDGYHARVTCECATAGCIGCSTHVTATLDLDAAESAHPGLFQGQHIDVQLRFSAKRDCVGHPGAATLAVEMMRK